MSDNLEKFIRQNRDQFDTETPRDKLWSRIHDDLNTNKEVKKISWYKYAAAALLLLSVGAVIGLTLGNKKTTPQLVMQQQIEESEQKFTQLVNNKLDELSEYDFDQKLLTDIDVLDQIHMELKTELIQNSGANSKVVVQAMIKNYQAKLDALERILKKVKTKDLEAQSKESSTIY